MLKINVEHENFDEDSEKFVMILDFSLELEHSLVALSKWESKYKKPYLSLEKPTTEEALYYIEMMILDDDYPADFASKLSEKNLTEIREYIEDTMTATWFEELVPQPKSSEQITSELVYYWMASLQIPWEAQYWHMNRLFTLIKIFGAKNAKPKKMNSSEERARRLALNKKRQEELGITG